jgi:hypothetical protein
MTDEKFIGKPDGPANSSTCTPSSEALSLASVALDGMGTGWIAYIS